MSPEGPKAPSKNAYEHLGLPKESTDEEITRAFRELAKEFHPDTAGGGNEEKFKEISEAYMELKTPEKRKLYDQTLQEARSHKWTQDEFLQEVLRTMSELNKARENPNLSKRKGTFIINSLLASYIEKDGERISKEYDAIIKDGKFVVGRSYTDGDCLLDPRTGKETTKRYKKITKNKNGNFFGTTFEGKSEKL